MKKQFCILLTLTVTISSFAQGNLTPTGPPGATMKTLAQIQPRTPISSVPFTITNSGSYYLTTNLVGINGIIISTNSVTLDLNGFWLNGLGGIGKGIDVTYNSAPRTNIAVFNGNVSGFGGIGVDLSSAVNSRIERVQVSNNGGRGLRIRDGGLVMACVVSDNGDFGMQISSDCAVTDCIVRGNQTYGIVGDHNNTIRHCSVLNNDGSGIWLSGNGSHISDCTVNRNTSTNINTYAIRVAECSSATDYTVRYNHGVGIFVDGGSTVRGCTVDYGDSDGIVAIGP
ncbi:MAG: right-handed parallel beta-helix repeat-containing protein, partial [Limisphaerales bacterium]